MKKWIRFERRGIEAVGLDLALPWVGWPILWVWLRQNLIIDRSEVPWIRNPNFEVFDLQLLAGSSGTGMAPYVCVSLCLFELHATFHLTLGNPGTIWTTR